MAYLPVVTCAEEGGLYSPDRDPSAPIRIYSDRWVEDDVLVQLGHPKRRERLSKEKYRQVKLAAHENRKAGLV